MAYRQPVSRGDLGAARRERRRRDAGCSSSVATSRWWATPKGPGQPALFGTTDLFLERLGLNSLEQLPAVEDFLPGPEVAGDLERDLRSAMGLGVETSD